MLADQKMKIGALTSLLIIFGTSACVVKPVVSVSSFSIAGRVYDEETKLPLENVKVYFIDTGYDYVRSKQTNPIEIGRSDSNGEINLRLNYVWRRSESSWLNPPKETLVIELSKEYYKPKRFRFDESEFKGDGIIFFINLEEVSLVPNQE